MVARSNLQRDYKGWRCYSPSTLEDHETKYKGGDCYCSRDAQVHAALVDAGCAPPSPAPAPIFPGAVPVFYPGLGGSKCFRIPTIIKTSAGTLLAFAENRETSCGDNGKHSLVLRRSLDNGTSWGAMQTVMVGPVPCPGCPAAVSNPNPVEVTLPDGRKAVLLHYDTMNNPSKAKHGLDMQLWSFDDGLSWSNQSVLAYPPLKNDGEMIGPSVGLQNANGTIFFIAHGTLPGNFLYYSRDYGQSWTPSLPKYPVTGTSNECSIAFLKNPTDGRIIMNCRVNSVKNRAQYIWEPDGAGGYKPSGPSYPAGMIDPGCQGSIINLNGTLYVSNAGSTTGRTHMNVKHSTDMGRTWSKGLSVWPGPSGYSQLVGLAFNANKRTAALGLLFESGRKSSNDAISFVALHVRAEQGPGN